MIIHFHDYVLNDRWTDAFVGKSEANRCITVINFEDGPDRAAHLLALHVSGVTGNTQC